MDKLQQLNYIMLLLH